MTEPLKGKARRRPLGKEHCAGGVPLEAKPRLPGIPRRIAVSNEPPGVHPLVDTAGDTDDVILNKLMAFSGPTLEGSRKINSVRSKV